jgi:N-acetylglucosamine kinase-like BadF-type ATPase
MSADVVVGIDVGGTKTHVRIEALDGGLLHDEVFATPLWRAESNRDKARLVCSWITEFISMETLAALALGAHGCDNDEESERLRQRILPLVGAPTIVVNDSQLLAAAAGLPGSIELIAGTGSIAVGRTALGRSVYAGGWGWMVGDEGGAAGLVREAVRRLTRSSDEGSATDLLEAKLLKASGTHDLKNLTMAMMKNGGAVFTGWAPVLFDAADRGSTIAIDTIESAADELVRLVAILLGRQVEARAVVTAGSVIVNQPRLSDALRGKLERDFGLPLVVLHTAPVHGAIQLARTLIHPIAPNPGIGSNPSFAATPRKE